MDINNDHLSYEDFNNFAEIDNNFCLINEDHLNANTHINNNNIVNNNNNYKDNHIDNKEEENEHNNSKQNIDEKFGVIKEAPEDEEETINKKRKNNSILTDSNNNINNNITNNKPIVNNNKWLKELDALLINNSQHKNANKTKVLKKEKKLTLEEFNKKYKSQDMGTNFSDMTLFEQDKKPKKNRQKKSKKNFSKLESEEDIEIREENIPKKRKRRCKKNKEDDSINNSINVIEYPEPENLDDTALKLEMKKYGMKPQLKTKNIEILKGVYKFLKIRELPTNISNLLTSFLSESNESNSQNGLTINNSEFSKEQKKSIIKIIKGDKNLYEKILLFKEISLKEVKKVLNDKGVIVPNNLLSDLLLESGAVLPGGWNKNKNKNVNN